MTSDHTTSRRAALALLKAGAANLSEVARLAGVDRQLVRYWVKAAGINWHKIRDTRLHRLWERETRQ